MRGVRKELESGRVPTNHGCVSGLPAGDLALGGTPAGQGDAGADFVSVALLHYGMGVAHGPPTGGLKTAMLGVCVRT